MKDTSDAAFPNPGDETGGWQGGMSLRDYFAAKAMQALIAKLGTVKFRDVAETLSETAGAAYQFADAMLEARKS